MKREISHWKLKITTVTVVPVGMGLQSPTTRGRKRVHISKGATEIPELFSTHEERKGLLQNSSEANYLSFHSRLRAIYWGFCLLLLKTRFNLPVFQMLQV